jgi:hypothetical protein
MDNNIFTAKRKSYIEVGEIFWDKLKFWGLVVYLSNGN